MNASKHENDNCKKSNFISQSLFLFIVPGSGRSNARSAGSVGHMNALLERDSHVNVSPTMSYGVLKCDIVLLQNYMLMIL